MVKSVFGHRYADLVNMKRALAVCLKESELDELHELGIDVRVISSEEKPTIKLMNFDMYVFCSEVPTDMLPYYQQARGLAIAGRIAMYDINELLELAYFQEDYGCREKIEFPFESLNGLNFYVAGRDENIVKALRGRGYTVLNGFDQREPRVDMNAATAWIDPTVNNIDNIGWYDCGYCEGLMVNSKLIKFDYSVLITMLSAGEELDVYPSEDVAIRLPNGKEFSTTAEYAAYILSF